VLTAKKTTSARVDPEQLKGIKKASIDLEEFVYTPLKEKLARVVEKMTNTGTKVTLVLTALL
jgi:hypothetical protein